MVYGAVWYDIIWTSALLPSQSTWLRTRCGCGWGMRAPSTPVWCSSARSSLLAARWSETELQRRRRRKMSVSIRHMRGADAPADRVNSEWKKLYWSDQSNKWMKVVLMKCAVMTRVTKQTISLLTESSALILCQQMTDCTYYNNPQAPPPCA